MVAKYQLAEVLVLSKKEPFLAFSSLQKYFIGFLDK